MSNCGDFRRLIRNKYNMSIPPIWQPFFFLGSLTVTVTVSTMAAAESPSYQQQPRNAYPQEFVSNYVSNCRERSQRSGLTPQQAQTICQCTIFEYQDRFSIEEFVDIVQQLQETGQAPDELVDVALTCSAKLDNN